MPSCASALVISHPSDVPVEQNGEELDALTRTLTSRTSKHLSRHTRHDPTRSLFPLVSHAMARRQEVAALTTLIAQRAAQVGGSVTRSR